MTRFAVILGAVLGGTVGFLLRPARTVVGQLPFSTVITRGSKLTGLDVILKGEAETSFNYLLAGVLIGMAVGWVLKLLFSKRIE
jgi:gas vesicle protein